MCVSLALMPFCCTFFYKWYATTFGSACCILKSQVHWIHTNSLLCWLRMSGSNWLVWLLRREDCSRFTSLLLSSSKRTSQRIIQCSTLHRHFTQFFYSLSKSVIQSVIFFSLFLPLLPICLPAAVTAIV